jgi:hypothetical protein
LPPGIATGARKRQRAIEFNAAYHASAPVTKAFQVFQRDHETIFFRRPYAYPVIAGATGMFAILGDIHMGLLTTHSHNRAFSMIQRWSLRCATQSGKTFSFEKGAFWDDLQPTKPSSTNRPTDVNVMGMNFPPNFPAFVVAFRQLIRNSRQNYFSDHRGCCVAWTRSDGCGTRQKWGRWLVWKLGC